MTMAVDTNPRTSWGRSTKQPRYMSCCRAAVALLNLRGGRWHCNSYASRASLAERSLSSSKGRQALYERPRGRSHYTVSVQKSAHALSSPRGTGILAPAPRCDQRAGGRRPTHTRPPPSSEPSCITSRALGHGPDCPPTATAHALYALVLPRHVCVAERRLLRTYLLTVRFIR